MSLGDMEIKPCQNEFLPQLTELWKEYIVDQNEEDYMLPYFDLDASTEGFRRILESFMRKEPEGFLVATLGSEVVGFVVSFKDAFSPNYVVRKKTGRIQAVHVKRGFRERGIGTRLVNSALRYLKASGCSIIMAETGGMNNNSLKMLEKLGFKRHGNLVQFMRED